MQYYAGWSKQAHTFLAHFLYLSSCFWLTSLLSCFFLSKIREKFIANVRNIMQTLSECLELSHSLNNFTLGNKNRHIMKTNADKGKTEEKYSTPKQRKASSKNAEIRDRRISLQPLWVQIQHGIGKNRIPWQGKLWFLKGRSLWNQLTPQGDR